MANKDYENFERIFDQFPTKKGLLFVVLLIWFSSYYINYWVSITLTIVSIFIWLISAGYIFYKSNSKINIVIALRTNWASSGLLVQLKKMISRDIKARGEKKEINVKFLPEDRFFENNTEAETFVKKKEVDLLIWGECIETNNVVKFRTNFTHNFHIFIGLVREIGFEEARKKLGKSITQGAPHTKLVFDREYSPEEIEKSSGDLSCVSLYIIARSIATNFSEENINLAKEIVMSILRQSNLVDKNFKREIQNTSSLFSEALCLINIGKQDNSELEKNARELLRLQPNSLLALLNLAKIEWRKGNKDISKQHVKTAKKIKPRDPVVALDEAFFAFDEGNFRKAVDKIREIGDPRSNIVDNVAFYLEEYETTKKLQFLFGAGYLYLYFEADKDTGVEIMGDFIAKSYGKSEEFEYLIKIAEGFIKQGN